MGYMVCLTIQNKYPESEKYNFLNLHLEYRISTTLIKSFAFCKIYELPSVPVAQASKMDWHRWQVGDEENFLDDCRENRSKETQATAAQPQDEKHSQYFLMDVKWDFNCSQH